MTSAKVIEKWTQTVKSHPHTVKALNLQISFPVPHTVFDLGVAFERMKKSNQGRINGGSKFTILRASSTSSSK